MSVPPNGSLGDFTISPPQNSTVAAYQPVALQNNQTLYDSYGQNHTPLGSSQNAGYHTVVTLSPTSEPNAITGIWQIYSDGNAVYAVPPSGSGIQQQLNSSAIPSSGTYWSQTQTITGAPPITIFYSCPLGSNSIAVIIQLQYTTAALTATTVLVPFLDSSGSPFSITTPTAAFGLNPLISNGSGGAYGSAVGWGISTSTGSLASGVGVYANGVVMNVGKSFSTTSGVTVSATVFGTM